MPGRSTPGVTAAPFGGLDEDGLRLRAVGGYGAYTYSGRRAAGVGSRIREFEGETAFADLLAGYQKQLGPLTVKGFAGLMTAGNRITPDDPETAIRGRGLGAKLALETWWTISEQAWASVDVSWGTIHDTYAARGRLGWRLLPDPLDRDRGGRGRQHRVRHCPRGRLPALRMGGGRGLGVGGLVERQAVGRHAGRGARSGEHAVRISLLADQF